MIERLYRVEKAEEMPHRKRRTDRKALKYITALIATPIVVIFGLSIGPAWADEIDSIRSMPTAMPEATAHDVDYLAQSPMTRRSGLPETSMIADGVVEQSFGGEPWTWQPLPEGLIFRSYLAGGREPRLGAQWVHIKGWGWLWDSSLGGRVALVRYGTQNPLAPQGWELGLEGAAFPRLTLDHQRDMISSDFRFGVPLSCRRGRWEAKFAFYHLSSHLADEYMLIHPERERINYSRDALTFAVGVFPNENWRFYAECGWAWWADGGSDPWEFQFGIEYSPLYPNGINGAPFFAINTRIREEVDYGGNMTVQTGWQWRGWSGERLRLGFQYFNGMSDQYQFFREFEEQVGLGIWYDF